MKFIYNLANIKLAPEGGVHQIKSVALDDVYVHMVTELRPVDINRLRSADNASNNGMLLRGRPIYWAWESASEQLLLYPVPDHDYDAFVRYYPQVREL